MAKRPTMSNLQKQINDLQIHQQRTNQRLDEHDTKFDIIDEREIIKLLQEKNMPNSPRYRYTYEEIASKMNCSYSTVHNIAKDNGLSRRLKSVD